MPGKKGKGAKKADADEEAPTPEQLAQNYSKICKALGVRPEQEISKDILNEEREEPYARVVAGDVDLGPAGVRAIVEALLRRPLGGQRLAGKMPYSAITAFRLWRCNAGDDGVLAVADLLTAKDQLAEDQPPDLVMKSIVCVELMANGVGPRGCEALGAALKTAPPALVTLNLPYNGRIGDDGVALLCEGLAANPLLKNLNLNYCDVREDGAAALAAVLATPTCALAKLDLQGNEIGFRGAARLSVGLKRNISLTALNLADNNIGGFPPNDEELGYLRQFVDNLLPNQTLAALDFIGNAIGVEGATIMQPLVTPDRTVITKFTLDAALPAAVLETMVRVGGGKGKKGKKGKKKK